MFSSSYSFSALRKWLLELQWTPESTLQWQEFYNNASRRVIFGVAGNFSYENLPQIPEYEDLKPLECKKIIISSAVDQKSFIFLILISFVITTCC